MILTTLYYSATGSWLISTIGVGVGDTSESWIGIEYRRCFLTVSLTIPRSRDVHATRHSMTWHIIH